jgi:hypothetical protein
MCFSFRKGDAYDVEIMDHHRGIRTWRSQYTQQAAF